MIRAHCPGTYGNWCSESHSHVPHPVWAVTGSEATKNQHITATSARQLLIRLGHRWCDILILSCVRSSNKTTTFLTEPERFSFSACSRLVSREQCCQIVFVSFRDFPLAHHKPRVLHRNCQGQFFTFCYMRYRTMLPCTKNQMTAVKT